MVNRKFGMELVLLDYLEKGNKKNEFLKKMTITPKEKADHLINVFCQSCYSGKTMFEFAKMNAIKCANIVRNNMTQPKKNMKTKKIKITREYNFWTRVIDELENTKIQ